KNLVLGIGCERGASGGEALALALESLVRAGLSPQSISLVASIDVKADEAAMHHVARHFGCAARFFDAATLEAQTPRLKNPSDIVFAEVGCHGVAEGAALAAAGALGELVAEKRKSRRATCAIGQAPQPFVQANLPGRARGK